MIGHDWSLVIKSTLPKYVRCCSQLSKLHDMMMTNLIMMVACCSLPANRGLGGGGGVGGWGVCMSIV